MFWIPLVSCPDRVVVNDPVMIEPLIGLSIVAVGIVVSSVICVVPVMTIPVAKLINLVVSVLSPSPVDKMIFTYPAEFIVQANVPCVLPAIVYPAASLTYTRPLINCVLVYKDGNCNRALNPLVLPVPGCVIWIQIDGCPLHCRDVSV